LCNKLVTNIVKILHLFQGINYESQQILMQEGNEGAPKCPRLVWVMIRRRSTEKTFCNYLTTDTFSLGGRFWRQYSVRFSHSVVNDEPVDGHTGTSKSAYTKLSVSLNLFWAVINWSTFQWTVEACRPLNLQEGNTYFRSYNIRLITWCHTCIAYLKPAGIGIYS